MTFRVLETAVSGFRRGIPHYNNEVVQLIPAKLTDMKGCCSVSQETKRLINSYLRQQHICKKTKQGKIFNFAKR